MFGQSLDPEIGRLRAELPHCAYSKVQVAGEGICICNEERNWSPNGFWYALQCPYRLAIKPIRAQSVRERHSVRLTHAERAGVRALYGLEREEEDESWPETTAVDLGPVVQTKFGW